MKPDEYMEATTAMNTNLTDYSVIQKRMGTEENSKLIHYSVGVGSESGELLDIVKKATIYGKKPDVAHIKEELGDLSWYMNEIMKMYNLTWEEVFAANVAKLRERYKGGFTEKKALNRNLDKERQVLENKS